MQGKNDILAGEDRIQFDFDSILRDICRQWWVIILAALTAAFLTGTYLKLCYVPIYTTSTTFVVGKSGFSSNSVADNLKSAESITENFSVITESSLLKKRVCEDLDIPSFDARVYVSAVESSNLMTLTVQSNTPRMTYLTCLSVMECSQELCAAFLCCNASDIHAVQRTKNLGVVAAGNHIANLEEICRNRLIQGLRILLQFFQQDVGNIVKSAAVCHSGANRPDVG